MSSSALLLIVSEREVICDGFRRGGFYVGLYFEIKKKNNFYINTDLFRALGRTVVVAWTRRRISVIVKGTSGSS